MSDESTELWYEQLNAAISVGLPLATGTSESDKLFDHVVRLLQDSSLLLEAGSPASSAFIAITALEEIAKIQVSMYRRSGVDVKRSKDPLYNHKHKHHVAAAPTVAMGSRLQKAIGEDRMYALLDEARSGKLVEIRESALYVQRLNGELHLPIETVQKTRARELLLFAVEAFDDAFVGLTNHTGELEIITDKIFSMWAEIM